MVKVNLRGRDFIAITDFSVEEIETFLDLSLELKRKRAMGEPHELLRGKTLAMIFERPSTRTRVSFEAAMTQLGGHAQDISTTLHTLAPGRGVRVEPWKDTARVLSRYVDCIMVRLENEEDTLEVVKNSTVPIINGGPWVEHPCQGLGDVLTIREKKGLKGVKGALVWAPMHRIGKKDWGSGVSMLYAGLMLGMDWVWAYPKGYEPDDDVLRTGEEMAEIGGGSFEISNDKASAVEGVDVIKIKGHTPTRYFENPETKPPHIIDPEKYEGWRVDTELVKKAKRDVIVMHALPADRPWDVTTEVIEGPNSVIFDEAENRLHAQKGVLVAIMR